MTKYQRMLSKIDKPITRYLASLLVGVVLLLPILVGSVLCMVGIVLSQCLIVNPINAYKGDFEC